MNMSASQTSLDTKQVVNILREYGIIPTQPRIRIGAVLFSKPQHVSAEQLLALVNSVEEKVSKATVYNTLGLFAAKGLLHEVIIDPTKVFYDTNLEKHHHLYHVDTGELEDIPYDQVKIKQLPDLPVGTVLEDVDIIIRLRQSG